VDDHRYCRLVRASCHRVLLHVQVVLRPDVRTGPDVEDVTNVLNVKLDVKSKTGCSECIEMEYPKYYDVRQGYPVRLKWLACGAVVEDIKSVFMRTAKRLGHVTVVQVPTVSRFGLTLSDLDVHVAWSWQRPSRCNSALSTTPFGASLLEACKFGNDSILPVPVMAKFESSMVVALGVVPDVFHRGKLAGAAARIFPARGEGVVAIHPVCDPNDTPQAEAEEAGVQLLPHGPAKPGWFRQYIHPGLGYCIRLDADGILLIPCVNSAGNSPKDVCSLLVSCCQSG
jgi:hypothetical protein